MRRRLQIRDGGFSEELAGIEFQHEIRLLR